MLNKLIKEINQNRLKTILLLIVWITFSILLLLPLIERIDTRLGLIGVTLLILIFLAPMSCIIFIGLCSAVIDTGRLLLFGKNKIYHLSVGASVFSFLMTMGFVSKIAVDNFSFDIGVVIFLAIAIFACASLIAFKTRPLDDSLFK